MTVVVSLIWGVAILVTGILIGIRTSTRHQPKPVRACGLEMAAGTGVICRRGAGHRGRHLVAPDEMISAGFTLPEF